MNGNRNGGSAIETGLNLLALLLGGDGDEEKRSPVIRAGAPTGRRAGAAGCNCTGRRVPPVRTPK